MASKYKHESGRSEEVRRTRPLMHYNIVYCKHKYVVCLFIANIGSVSVFVLNF